MPQGVAPSPGEVRRRGSGHPPPGLPPPLMEDEGDQHAQNIMSEWMISDVGGHSTAGDQVTG